MSIKLLPALHHILLYLVLKAGLFVCDCPLINLSLSFSCLICFSSPPVLWVNASARQVDLSFLSARNEYLLGVTAVINESESESVPQNGITFTYFKDSFVDQKCK